MRNQGVQALRKRVTGGRTQAKKCCLQEQVAGCEGAGVRLQWAKVRKQQPSVLVPQAAGAQEPSATVLAGGVLMAPLPPDCIGLHFPSLQLYSRRALSF